jgi:hypothetical protein
LSVARTQEEIERDRAEHEAARREMFRRDGERPLGENIEQGDRLIRQAQELARAFTESRR